MAEPSGTRIYSVPEAARLLGISERAVRKRITTGALDAEREGNGPWQVRLGAEGAVPAGTEGGTDRNHGTARSEPIEAAYSTGDAPTVALVPIAAVADQLQGFAERLAELAQRNEALALEVGTLRERDATKTETIADLRRQLAEAQSAPPAAPQPLSATPPPSATTDTPDAPGGAGGFWARVRRAFAGE